ncbi:hypothetical protein BDQ17DRAFT_1436886 [Cyathus striatus]|nr:hypothetical protein BDQ17DRAFT_1436886 [Cyathus striatus]
MVKHYPVYVPYSKERMPKDFRSFHYFNRSLLLNPQIFGEDDYTAKDGIAIVCRATIETRYANIGFKIQFAEYPISGIICGRSIHREAGPWSSTDNDLKWFAKHWVFEEMDPHFQESRFFSIGMYYSERGSGLWNHLTIKDDAGLKVVQAQVFTSLLEIDQESFDFDLRRYPSNTDYTNYSTLMRTSYTLHWRGRGERIDALRLLLKWLKKMPELKTPVVNVHVALKILLGEEVAFEGGALNHLKALTLYVETLFEGELDIEA